MQGSSTPTVSVGSGAQKRRANKKVRRKRHRQMLALARKEEQKENDDSSCSDSDEAGPIQPTAPIVPPPSCPPPNLEFSLPAKHLINSRDIILAEDETPSLLHPMTETRSQRPPPDRKQHTGLRCRKCFALLVRDEDFDLVNTLLVVNPVVFTKKAAWEGLIIRAGKIFCQNMHQVGVQERVALLGESRMTAVLQKAKTTWQQNFVENPAFANSEKLVNKLRLTDGRLVPVPGQEGGISSEPCPGGQARP
ncbi:hypothetical protein PAPYR_6253 [Paratrimastix pyriformis]|uniref:Uncharacterized protein n=1 Tax=Paratrimastix pyriformis TaxID=342808 RepID=A0ABQ8UK97_9EUKA|nr:hypothetical protein PAPYR_6253 [Paratrimastix pyriformis]